MEHTAGFMEPIMQAGFAGFSGVLIGTLIWAFKQILSVVHKNNTVVAANTEAVGEVIRLTKDELGLVRSLSDKLLSRPCIAKKDT